MDEGKNKFLAEFSEKQRQQAFEKYKIIEPFLNGDVPLTNVSHDTTDVSAITLHRWIKKYRKNGLVGLISKKRKDCGQHRSVRNELQTFIEGLALQKPPLSIASIYRKTLEIAEKNNWRKPAYKTVYTIVKNMHPALVTLAQEGSKAYSDKYDLLYSRRSTYPNEIWQADHSLMDIWLVDDNGKYRRPWLTVIMDDYSRAIAGYFLTFQDPCAQNTSLVLRQAIWYKTDPEWHVCGIPDIFYTDHGSDFTSVHLEQVSVDIKMQLVYSIAGKPRGRGIIERFFETINQLFLSNLPGYMPEGEFPEKSPTMKINELELLLKKFLLKDYNFRVHSETKMPPQEFWEKGGFVPRLPDSLEQLDLLLLTEAKARKVHQDGIHFNTLKYIDATLAAYVGEDVIIRYDPRDVAEIRVFHKNLFLCRAVSPEIARQTVTLKDIRQARNHRKQQLKGEIKSKAEMIDLLLGVHNEDTCSPFLLKNDDSSPKCNDESISETKTKLKRYRNE
jgi:putative transposase